MHAPVQHFHQSLQGLQANAGMSFCQHIDAQKHDCPHLGGAEKRTDIGGMAANQVQLQFRDMLGRNRDRAELPKTGGEPINHVSTLDYLVHIVPAFLHFCHTIRSQFNPSLPQGNILNLLQSQAVTVNHYLLHVFPLADPPKLYF